MPLRVVPSGPPARGTWCQANGRAFWSEGPRVIEWIESWCVFTEGEWAGQPFRLMRWQKRLLVELFELEWRAVRGRWRWIRRYRRALVGLPRKSGKSELAAALALYLAFADEEPTAKVYCAASSEKQADIVFSKCKTMVGYEAAEEWDVPMAGEVRIETSRLTWLQDPNCYVERLTGQGGAKHGLNPHGVVLDELHTWGKGQNAELWRAMTTGSAARSQPMQVAITTAGIDLDDSRCGDLYKLGRRIERGEIEPGGFYFKWYAAPEWRCAICGRYVYDEEACRGHSEQRLEKTDHRDPEMWRLASPSYGEVVSGGFYEDELNSTTEADFRRLYLNQWVDYAATPWLPAGVWDACRMEGLDLAAGAHRTFAGIDLSESRDSTAVAVGQVWEGDERPCGHTAATHGPFCLAVQARIWEPPLDPEGRTVEGYEIPQAEVKQHIRERNAALEVWANTFDPWHSKLMRQDLEAEGLPCEDIWQTGARRIGATAALFDLVMQGRLHHDGDPVLARHVGNAASKPVSTGGSYLAKRKGGRAMDGAMALVNVMYGVQWAKAPEKPAPPSFWIPGEDEE